MIGIFLRKIAGLLVPVAILAAAIFSLPSIAAVTTPWKEIIPYIPAPAIMVGLLLSFQFRRGRVFLAFLLLAALYWASHYRLAGGSQALVANNAFSLLAMVFPVNLTLIMFMRERGVLTVAGRMRLGFLAFQAAGIAWLLQSHGEGIADILNREMFHSPLPEHVGIPQPALLVLAPSLLISALRLYVQSSPVNGALVGTLACAAAVWCWPAAPDIPAVFITAASLSLILGVLQDSHDMAFRDDLTGLPSRRALNERLADMGRRYVIAMLDVDHFKGFNDAYGHDVGDQVLKMVARKIQGVRGGGKSYRYGGEEFTVVFTRRGLEEAIPFLEEVRRAVADYRLVLRDSSRPDKSKVGRKLRGQGEGESVSVTISIGVAESGENKIPADVVKEADEALYRAKRKGRNILSK